jgi:hypothetical protein
MPKKRGTMVGNITIIDSGDEIDCRRMGSGGYAIPSITEPDVIEFKKCEAKFVLHVEKDTVWGRFNEDRFWEKHNCILTEGSGQPPRGVRRLLRRLNEELGLPIYCLLDCDPWGHYIYSVIKQGSISLAFESERLAIPNAKFLGVRAKDYHECELSDDVQIELNDTTSSGREKSQPIPGSRSTRAGRRRSRGCSRTASRWKSNPSSPRTFPTSPRNTSPSACARRTGWTECLCVQQSALFRQRTTEAQRAQR